MLKSVLATLLLLVSVSAMSLPASYSPATPPSTDTPTPPPSISIPTSSNAVNDPQLLTLWSNDGVTPLGYIIGNNHGYLIARTNGSLTIMDDGGNRLSKLGPKYSLALPSPTISAASNTTLQKSLVFAYSRTPVTLSVNFTSASGIAGVKVRITVTTSVALPSTRLNFTLTYPTPPVVLNNIANFSRWVYDWSDVAAKFVVNQSYNGTAFNWQVTLPRLTIGASVTLDPKIVTTASASATLPDAQQRVFQNTRGTKAYYAFYRDTLGGNDECYFAFSTTGAAGSWTTGQTIGGLVNGQTSCSAIFVEDATNSRSIVYVVISTMAEAAGAANDLKWNVGLIADTGSTISWSTLANVKAASTKLDYQFPVVAFANNSYLHVVSAFINTAGAANSGGFEICNNNTQKPTTTTTTWTCNENSVNASPSDITLIPHVLTDTAKYHSVIITKACVGTETVPCSRITGLSGIDSMYGVAWTGTTQTLTCISGYHTGAGGIDDCAQQGNSFFCDNTIYAVADVDTVSINSVSQVITASCQMGGLTPRKIQIRHYNPPGYTPSLTPEIQWVSGDNLGIHLTFNGQASAKKWFIFFVNSTTTISSISATTAWETCTAPCASSNWSALMTEYTNSTTAPRWVSSPYIVNNATGYGLVTTIPFIWVQQAATAELWFSKHQLPVPPVQVSFGEII